MATNVVDLRQFFAQHRLLAELYPENELIFRCDGDAPAPSKDYGQLEIDRDHLTLRWWRICLKNVEGSIYPREIRDNFDDFSNDEVAQREILRIFGPTTLNYVFNIVSGQIDWISRLPQPIQIQILSNLNLDDISRVSLVSKRFRFLSRQNELWKHFYFRQHSNPSAELIRYGERRGWRRIFFTSRIKLQMELRREAKRVEI